MTTQEMHIRITQRFQELRSNRNRNILPDQIDFSLNIGVRKFINKKVSPFLDSTGKKIEVFDTQRRLDDLRMLRVKDKELTIANNAGDLPADYMYLINDRTIFENCDVQQESPNRLVDGEYLHNHLQNYLYKPSVKSPISDISGNKIYVYLPDGITPQKIIIDYLRYPKQIALEDKTVSMIVDGQQQNVNIIAQDCELPDHTHDHIVELAIQEMMLSVNSPAYQQNVQDTMIKNPE